MYLLYTGWISYWFDYHYIEFVQNHKYNRHGGLIPWDDDLDICVKEQVDQTFMAPVLAAEKINPPDKPYLVHITNMESLLRMSDQT